MPKLGFVYVPNGVVNDARAGDERMCFSYDSGLAYFLFF